MPDTPESIGELGRLLKSMESQNANRFSTLERQFTQQFDALDRRLDRVVSSELHAASIQAIHQQIANLTGALAAEVANRQSAISDVEKRRQDADSDANRRMDRIVNGQRWMIGVIALPIILLIVQLFRSTPGA